MLAGFFAAVSEWLQWVDTSLDSSEVMAGVFAASLFGTLALCAIFDGILARREQQRKRRPDNLTRLDADAPWASKPQTESHVVAFKSRQNHNEP